MLLFLKDLISRYFPSSCPDSTQTKNPDKYAVYIFLPNPNKHSAPQWRKVGATNCARHAVKQARLLHKKKQYQRVEVKKCTFSRNDNRSSCKTIRIYDKQSYAPW